MFPGKGLTFNCVFNTQYDVPKHVWKKSGDCTFWSELLHN